MLSPGSHVITSPNAIALLLPARGEKVEMRGRFRLARNSSNAPSPGLLRNPTSPARRRGEEPSRPADKQNRSRGALVRPSFANHDAISKNKFASGNKKREAERRKAHAIHVRVCADKCARTCATHPLRGCAPFRGHARLSALTLAALATGYHPDGSAPEPGFPQTNRAGVLPAWPACLRLSTLRADRSFCRSTGDPEPPGTN